MTPMSQLPEWVNMGDSGGGDFAGPTSTLVDLLKKRMKQRPQGGAGAMMGGELSNDMATGKAMQPEGTKSL